MCALANISGGLSSVISSLGESLESCSSPAQIADTLGALANLLLDYEISAQAVPEEIISPATRVLQHGTLDGKTHATAAVARFLHVHSIDKTLADTFNHAGTVLALASLQESATMEDAAASEALEALLMCQDQKD